MLVPRNKLLFWTAVVVLPFALLGAVSPPAVKVSLLLIGGLLAVALADAIGARNRLAQIGLELPAVARMSKDREAKLALRIRNRRQRLRHLRVALFLEPLNCRHTLRARNLTRLDGIENVVSGRFEYLLGFRTRNARLPATFADVEDLQNIRDASHDRAYNGNRAHRGASRLKRLRHSGSHLSDHASRSGHLAFCLNRAL